MKFARFAILAASLLVEVSAATGASLSPCYSPLKMPLIAAAPGRELFVLIDQTTQLSSDIRQSVLDNAGPLVTPGSAFTVATFSEALPGGFTTIRSAGIIEATVPAGQRDDISVPLLRRLDLCLANQNLTARGLAGSAIATGLNTSGASFAHSEIMASLRELSARVANSPARDRVILLVSDMLEHSSATTFYEKRTMRQVEPDTELRSARAAKLLGKFGGARVYIIGGGILPSGASHNIAATDALREFWRRWFKASGAELVEFGAPNLLTPIPPK